MHGMRARANASDRAARNDVSHFHVETEFLLQFPLDGMVRLFAALHPPTGQSPGKIRPECVFEDQNPSLRIEHDANRANRVSRCDEARHCPDGPARRRKFGGEPPDRALDVRANHRGTRRATTS